MTSAKRLNTIALLSEALALAQAMLKSEHWLNVGAMLADAVFETDADGRFLAFENAEFLGFPVSGILGLNLSDVFALRPEAALDPASFEPVFAAIRSAKSPWRGVVLQERADSTQIAYQLALAPKLSAEGGFAGCYGMLIDHHAPELYIAPADPKNPALDPQTGLWSAAAFTDEAARRFDRLDVEGLPGTLLLLGFGRTPPEGRNTVAFRLAEELRDIIRPTDLLGRITTTTFALWCDGMDHLTGAERAARFCQRLPTALPGNARISVGLATRWPGSADDGQIVIGRATAALRLAEQVSKEAADSGSTESVSMGTWRVWSPNEA
jgi:GGDEF domain-containing protein